MVNADEVTLDVDPSLHVDVDDTGHLVARARNPRSIKFEELQNGTFGAVDRSLMVINSSNKRGESWDLV